MQSWCTSRRHLMNLASQRTTWEPSKSRDWTGCLTSWAKVRMSASLKPIFKVVKASQNSQRRPLTGKYSSWAAQDQFYAIYAWRQNKMHAKRNWWKFQPVGLRILSTSDTLCACRSPSNCSIATFWARSSASYWVWIDCMSIPRTKVAMDLILCSQIKRKRALKTWLGSKQWQT